MLKPTGSFYLHCDWHANAYIRVMILDKIFGDKNFVNEIVWCYSVGGKSKRSFARKHDTIFFYSKTDNYFFDGAASGTFRNTGKRSWGGKIREDSQGRLYQDKIVKATGKHYIYYLDEPKIPEDWWTDINSIQSQSKERIGYPTQKPEALLERIIKASSNEGDIVLDAFCGGGTTPAVARRLGRKFIGIDQSVRAIAVSNARLEKQTDLLINDIYEVKTKAYSYDKLYHMKPLEFESLIIELFGGIPNTKQIGDGGKDGIIRIDGVALPIQVKKMNSVGRPLIQNFVGYLMQHKQSKGFFIAFDFAKSAYECVAEVKQNADIEIELVKVEDIVHLGKSTKITLDWNYETVYDKQYVTLTASGDNILLWQWDFDYNEGKGFSAEVLKDENGQQTINLSAGKHVIAVRGIDSEGIESIETITLYSNGSVHE